MLHQGRRLRIDDPAVVLRHFLPQPAGALAVRLRSLCAVHRWIGNEGHASRGAAAKPGFPSMIASRGVPTWRAWSCCTTSRQAAALSSPTKRMSSNTRSPLARTPNRDEHRHPHRSLAQPHLRIQPVEQQILNLIVGQVPSLPRAEVVRQPTDQPRDRILGERAAPQQRRQCPADPPAVATSQIDAENRFVDPRRPPLITRQGLTPPFPRARLLRGAPAAPPPGSARRSSSAPVHGSRDGSPVAGPRPAPRVRPPTPLPAPARAPPRSCAGRAPGSLPRSSRDSTGLSLPSRRASWYRQPSRHPPAPASKRARCLRTSAAG